MNQIVPAEYAHVEYVAAHLRHTDRAEIEALTEMTPLDALLVSFTASVESYAWVRNGVPVCVFGVSPDPEEGGVGCPWMIGTPDVALDKAFLMQASRIAIDRFNTLFPLLENWVHPDNAPSLKYLAALGFSFGELEMVGHLGAEFLSFYKEAAPCA